VKILKLFVVAFMTILLVHCNNDNSSKVKKVKISVIVVPSEEKAKEAYEKLNNKQNFSDIVREYSIGPNILNGGDLGFMAYEDMGLQLRNAIKDKNIGEFSDHVIYRSQYYILLKTDEKYVDIEEEKKVEEPEKIQTEPSDLYPQPNFLLSFLPFMIITISFASLNFFIAPRKGKNKYLYSILTLVPIFGMIVSIYLLSLTDIELFNRMDKIEKLLENINKKE